MNKATPTVTWAAPNPIFAGNALSSTQLNATASVPGTFSYTPASGTVLKAGFGQTLSVTFTPTDSTDFASVTTSVALDVLAAGASRSPSGVLYVVGTSTSNNIQVSLKKGVVTVNLHNGTTNFQTSLTGLTSLVVWGQANNQQISVDPSLTLAAVLFAGNGNNAVVQGGGGPTVEVGGSGNGDQLNGGSGRDILIADLGNAQLQGGGAGSILIGGSTDYDNNLSALDAALSEWSSTDSYATRTAALASTFNSSTVHDNGKANAIHGDGHAQSDWIFAKLSGSNKDVLSGIGSNDIETAIS